MRCKQPVFFFIFIFVTFTYLRHASAIEPISTGIAVGAAICSSLFYASYDMLKCKIYECCEDPWIKHNFTGLETALRQRIHGQHLVIDNTVKTIKRHWNNDNPSKALVLSFHGWTGGGKNFVSRIITEHLYKQAMESKFVHLFVSTLHFPHKSNLDMYKDQIRNWIKGNVTMCARTVFIFDEVDKLPEGLIDAIKPYIDHYPEISGVNYRKSIFIFLSNTAGNDITRYALDNWKNGNQREELTYKKLEEIITVGAFNEKGGLWHSTLIEKNLISLFLPFLPLERKHVKLCIKDDLRAKNYTVNDEIVDKIANELLYFPQDSKLYSKSGCKRVSEKVDLIMEDD